ncbi:RidA family protein [Falsiroseomonas oryzae]|uniref:RidA family protein n=1 Tax=Falsiroseomonas oryzae TaxID=2766473 RepID=UPI0022EA93C8|nr:RidA family protein [Roseomonas sp. MO-31]
MDAPVFIVLPEGPDRVAPFSHAVRAGPWLLVTGQMPTDPRDNRLPLPDGVEAQTRQVMENLLRVLDGAGFALRDVVQARVYLTHFARDYEAMNRTYASYFPPDRLPARTCVGVTGLARDALVEIDLVAWKPA